MFQMILINLLIETYKILQLETFLLKNNKKQPVLSESASSILF